MSAGRVQQLLVATLAFLVLAAGYGLRHQPDGRVHMWLRPGQGALIQTATGDYILLDGGEDPVLLSSFLGEHMSLLQWHLDLVVLTRWWERSTGAQVEVLRRYVPRRLWYPSSQPGESVQARWWDVVARAEQFPMVPGLVYEHGGVRVRVVSTAPVAVQVQVGRLVLLYTPTLRADDGASLGQGATVWMTRELPNEAPVLPTLVLLPASGAAVLPADLVLAHPRTTFLPTAPGQEVALTTDGVQFAWHWTKK